MKAQMNWMAMGMRYDEWLPRFFVALLTFCTMGQQVIKISEVKSKHQSQKVGARKLWRIGTQLLRRDEHRKRGTSKKYSQTIAPRSPLGALFYFVSTAQNDGRRGGTQRQKNYVICGSATRTLRIR